MSDLERMAGTLVQRTRSGEVGLAEKDQTLFVSDVNGGVRSIPVVDEG